MSELLLIDGCEINNWTPRVLDELIAGGVSAVQATCAVWEDARRTLDGLMDWRQRFARHSDRLVLARSSADVLAAQQNGKVAVVLGFQNTAPIEDDPRLLDVYHELGVRVVQLTYNTQNAVASGCLEPSDTGLSTFGRRVVARMNALGMLVDCSHVGDRSTRDAIDASANAIALTHTNPRWFCDHPRNTPDDILAAVAERDGVVGVTTYPNFIGGPNVSLGQFCDMVARLADQIGVDHVALGSDLSREWSDADLVLLRNGRLNPDPEAASWPRWQDWFSTASDFPALLDGLRAVGFDEPALTAVAGENWLRLFETVFTGEPADSGTAPESAIGHAGYTVSNLDSAIRFFTDNLGFVVRHRQIQDNAYTRETVGVEDAVVDNAILVPAGQRDGCELQLLQYLVPAQAGVFSGVSQPGSAHLALEVTDLLELYRFSSARGVRFISPPNRIDSGRNRGGFIAYAVGPDDLRVELVQRPRPGSTINTIGRQDLEAPR
ncbi:membrane dipeptidase [Sciscionella marina]|uniref:membrane dipeptidase n=1 Tax=Sciscionella marina TaxID=508770 RepID=UPI0003A24FDA|nr:membrane dipeptidase [Sciscionella marina]